MRLWVGNVDQGCEFALNLRRHGCHLVSKSQIERQVRSQFPVVLGVEPYERLSEATLRELVWQACVEAVGVILEKGSERPESKDSIGVSRLEGVQLHSFGRDSKLQRVRTLREKGIVVHLKRIPAKMICWPAPASLEWSNSRHVYPSWELPRYSRQ